MSIEISIFTATYNRANTLHRVWNSLCRQTFRNFEWVVIDDGSSDNTEDVVRDFASRSDFPVRYFAQRNRGKHTAYNAFARVAEGRMFCSIDSDDEVLPNCLERMLFHFNSIPEEDRHRYAGIMCLAQDQHGELIGDRFWEDDMDDDIVGVLLRHRKLGDKGGLNRIEVLREFPFPEDVERVYVPESYHIHGYTTLYRTRFVNEILIQPWTDRRADHLSNRLAEARNDAGTVYGLLAWPKYSMRHFWRNPRLFVSVTSGYIALALKTGKSLRRQYDEVGSAPGRILWFMLIPLGLLRFAARQLKSPND